MFLRNSTARPSDGSFPSEGKKSRSRTRLVEAAADAIAEKGFQRTSLDDIAARAGMTKGAIYSNFKSKEDLFLAVMAAKNLRITPVLESGLDARTLMRRLAEATIALLPKARAYAAFASEYHLYALTHEPMRRRIARHYEEMFARAMDHLRVEQLASPENFSIPLETLPVVTQSLGLGFLYQYFLTPHLVTEEAVFAAYDALVS
jgi:AcrR family transcriptional regulator